MAVGVKPVLKLNNYLCNIKYYASQQTSTLVVILIAEQRKNWSNYEMQYFTAGCVVRIFINKNKVLRFYAQL